MQALAFHNTQFDIVDRNGQPWLQAAQIAKALGYAREDAISRIYSRNADEFTPCMSQTVNLTASGNLQKEARIFSLRGAHLLAMFARTQVAKEFRRWVLDVLEGITEVPAKPVRRPKPQLGPISYPLEAWMTPPSWAGKLALVLPQVVGGRLEVSLDALTENGGTTSPTEDLLLRLTDAGYEVTACRAELVALHGYAASLRYLSGQLTQLSRCATAPIVF